MLGADDEEDDFDYYPDDEDEDELTVSASTGPGLGQGVGKGAGVAKDVGVGKGGGFGKGGGGKGKGGGRVDGFDDLDDCHCSHELLRNVPGGWLPIRDTLDAFRKAALLRSPLPVAAGFKVIDDNLDFVKLLPSWIAYWDGWPLLNIVLVRKGCLAHYVSHAHPHLGAHSKATADRAASLLAQAKLHIQETALKRFCLERNELYRTLLTQLSSSSAYLVEYEALASNPSTVLALLLERLGVYAKLTSTVASTDQTIHKDPIATYLSNPEEVRAMRPEQYDFWVPSPLRLRFRLG